MSLIIDEIFLTQTLAKLVQIDSSNPSLKPGSPGEAEIGAYLAEVMIHLGLAVSLDDLGAGRVNVVGVLKGTGGGRSLMLNGHIDTVSTAGMSNPLSGEIRQGRLYGRGSQDMKGGVAAMIAAAKAIMDAGLVLGGDILITAVADEEYASIGMADIINRYRADAAIVTEPTDLAICLAHRGFIWYEVETLGRAAHGSRYDEGLDANMRMGRFLAELDKLEQALRQRPPHPLVGVPSLHAAKLRGGTEMSVYAAQCHLGIERRTCPGETEAQVTQALQTIINALSAADPTFQATVKPSLVRPPFEIQAEADIVRVATAALTKHLGQRPAYQGGGFWTDAALLTKAGIDTILLGPIGQGLHSQEEWVDLQSVLDLAAILADTAIEFCQ